MQKNIETLHFVAASKFFASSFTLTFMECIIAIFANLPSGVKHTFAVSTNAKLTDLRRVLFEVVGQTPAGYKDSFRLHNNDGVEEHDVLLDSTTISLMEAGIANESTITIQRQGTSFFCEFTLYAIKL